MVSTKNPRLPVICILTKLPVLVLPLAIPRTAQRGCLRVKKLISLLPRGGLYAGTPQDSQTNYVRDFLGFLGITDVEFVYAEGLNMGEATKETALAKAKLRLTALAA